MSNCHTFRITAAPEDVPETEYWSEQLPPPDITKVSEESFTAENGDKGRVLIMSDGSTPTVWDTKTFETATGDQVTLSKADSIKVAFGAEGDLVDATIYAIYGAMIAVTYEDPDHQGQTCFTSIYPSVEFVS